MMKYVVSVPAAAALTVLATTAAAVAAPPVPVEGTLTLEDSCAFPVGMELDGKSKFISHGDSAVITSPGLRATVVNRETGASVDIILTGALHERLLPDGTFVGFGTGHNVFYGPDVEGLPYTTGRVDYTYDPFADRFVLGKARGGVVDLCTVLD